MNARATITCSIWGTPVMSYANDLLAHCGETQVTLATVVLAHFSQLQVRLVVASLSVLTGLLFYLGAIQVTSLLSLSLPAIAAPVVHQPQPAPPKRPVV